MKKSSLSVLIFIIIIAGFCLFNIANNSVTGQTGDQTPTPTSTPTDTTPTPEVTPEQTPETTPGITPEATPTPNPEGTTTLLSKNFTGIWKARVRRPETTDGSSTSSSGGSETTSSSSGDTTTTTLAHISTELFGSSIITFKLCVKDGKLEGTVQQGGVLIKGVITEQTIISENEVEFTAEGREGRTANIRLKLTGEREFIGTFADGHTFDGRKLNQNRGCLAPGVGPIMSGPPTMGAGGGNLGPSTGGDGRPTSGVGMSDNPSMGIGSGMGFGMGGINPPTDESSSNPNPTPLSDTNEPPHEPSMGGPGMGIGPGMGSPGGGPSMFGGEDVGE